MFDAIIQSWNSYVINQTVCIAIKYKYELFQKMFIM